MVGASVGALEQFRLVTIDNGQFGRSCRIDASKSQSQVNRSCEEFPGGRRIQRKRLLKRELNEKPVAVLRHPYPSVHALIGSGVRNFWPDIADLRRIFEYGPTVFTTYRSSDLAAQHPALIGIHHHNHAFANCWQHKHCGQVSMIPAVVPKPEGLLFTRAKPTKAHELLPYLLVRELRTKHAAHRLRREPEFRRIAPPCPHDFHAEQRKIGCSGPESRGCHFGIDVIAAGCLGAVPRMALSNSFGESRGRRLLKAAIHHSNWIQNELPHEFRKRPSRHVDDDLLGNRRPATRVAELPTRKNIDNDRLIVRWRDAS